MQVKNWVVKLFFFNCGFASLSQSIFTSFTRLKGACKNITRQKGTCEIPSALFALCPATCTLLGHFANLQKFHKVERWVVKFLDVRFLLWFSSLLTWLIWKRLRNSPRLGFFMFWDSTSFAMNETKSSLILGSF